ncbi:type IX secretion system ring subunit PorN/GldN [Flavobacterium tibetense]|jgi:gliding motility associated protien GldN|uniref:Gliding motility protein GldN n=1 Tax=Flavobacterium tibetense TaxID=2233533 RepID=A0A365P4G3_9FLAO|nr:gliding motility protein GldN [Flavobacterium tibetense]RBA29450.1 gliding motility protein GldN [Flavobacterium tibetense]
MNWRNLILVVALGLSSTYTFAQSNLLNAKTPDLIGKKTEAELVADNDKPLPYGYVHDRDILMGKRIWEIIDLDERVNFPLYFPVEGDVMLTKERQPLYNILINGIRDGKITEVYDSSYFTDKKSLADIEASLVWVDTTDVGREYFNAGETIPEEFITKTEIKAIDVFSYRVVGYWYFDKRQGELKYRMLGIAPVVPDVYTMNNEEKDYIDLFWVYFPAVRDVLHEAKAFNDRNSAMPFTFDHLLNSRRFTGVIYLEENVYGDRLIKSYMQENAQMQLLESERVKEKIRDFEQDMWNY